MYHYLHDFLPRRLRRLLLRVPPLLWGSEGSGLRRAHGGLSWHGQRDRYCRARRTFSAYPPPNLRLAMNLFWYELPKAEELRAKISGLLAESQLEWTVEIEPLRPAPALPTGPLVRFSNEHFSLTLTIEIKNGGEYAGYQEYPVILWVAQVGKKTFSSPRHTRKIVEYFEDNVAFDPLALTLELSILSSLMDEIRESLAWRYAKYARIALDPSRSTVGERDVFPQFVAGPRVATDGMSSWEKRELDSLQKNAFSWHAKYTSGKALCLHALSMVVVVCLLLTLWIDGLQNFMVIPLAGVLAYIAFMATVVPEIIVEFKKRKSMAARLRAWGVDYSFKD